MSAQFGRWNFNGDPPSQPYMNKVRALLAPYGPDGQSFYQTSGVSIVYSAFHTTREAQTENQPHCLSSGTILTWDGRLDNRTELIRALGEELTTESADVLIVATAFTRWGKHCLPKLVGDWALSLWDPRTQSLLLAKDFIGTRPLYYLLEKERVTWSTILDPLVILADRHLELDEEYMAGWLSFGPAPCLTPYVEIRSVPPSSYFLIDENKANLCAYWQFDYRERIRYRTDSEYEEHFRAVFAKSVRRRLKSQRPVLAELSGGMDSSSFVCVGDRILATGQAETPCLQTVSYYDDSEPNWNELPFFEIVEAARGQSGIHIDVSSLKDSPYAWEADRFVATPAAGAGRTPATKQLIGHMAANGHRVVLSGIGGDEFLGGISTPIPELADLLVEARIFRFASQLQRWALAKRFPCFLLLIQTLKRFLPSGLSMVSKGRNEIPWLSQRLLNARKSAVNGYQSRLPLSGPTPSFVENLNALEFLRSQLANTVPSVEPCHERRYPYLDRDLLQFLFAIPREQLIRPGQRRSLMRRALREIVPHEVLNRERKAHVIRSPLHRIQHTWAQISKLAKDSLLAELQLVDASRFQLALERARQGQPENLVPLLLTIHLELWLRHVRQFGSITAIQPPASATRTLFAFSPTNSV